uniref:Uncharacterized protein n=1 Tax=Caenorhabditis japonica TaxID=281687 RepID=A0A8R1EWE3_CAEJA
MRKNESCSTVPSYLQKLAEICFLRQSNLVTALEENVCLAMLSKEVIKKNGVEGRIVVHAKNSTKFDTNQKADVIVSETLDCCVFGEKCVETFLDAHQRFAHENTIFIPKKATVFIRLFSCREIFDIHCQDYGGVRYRSEYVKIGDEDAAEPYWCASVQDFAQFEYLSNAEEVYTVDFTSVDELKKALMATDTLKLKPKRDGVAHGFAIYFTTDLTGTGIVLNSAESTAWDVGIIPFKEPCVVKAGEEVAARWRLVNHRFDVLNEFYPDELKSADDCERLNIRYETAILDQLQKIRDDSYFKQMMAEVEPRELPHATDISAQIPVQCVLATVERKKPTKVVIGFNSYLFTPAHTVLTGSRTFRNCVVVEKNGEKIGNIKITDLE